MKFSYDSPIMEFINTTVHYAALNIIYCICCLPVFTIGPATAALYQVIMRETRGEQSYLIRNFFKNFKEMFIQSLFTSLFLFFIILVLVYNITFWFQMSGAVSGIIIVILLVMLLLTACTGIYVFPLMARFKNGFLQTMKNALFIALVNLKETFYLIMIHILAASMICFFAPSKIFMLLIGFTFIAYCNSYIFYQVFKNYEQKDNSVELNPPSL